VTNIKPAGKKEHREQCSGWRLAPAGGEGEAEAGPECAEGTMPTPSGTQWSAGLKI